MKFHTAIITAALFLFFSLCTVNLFAGTTLNSSSRSGLIQLAEYDLLEELEEMDMNDTDEKNDQDMDEEDVETSQPSEDDEQTSEDVYKGEEDTEEQSASPDEEDFTISDEKSCETEEAAGHVIVMIYDHGTKNDISYIKPGAELEFANQSGQAADITFSPSGFATSDSFTVQPNSSKSVFAGYPAAITTGKAIITINGTHTKHFFVICP